MKALIWLYKNEMFLVVLILSLFLWGLTMSWLAFKNESQVILIGKTETAYKIISPQDENKDKTSLKALNFIRHFIALTFNFDEESYIRNISLAGDLMSENLWNKKEAEFKETASFIKKNKVIQSSELLSLKKLNSSQYSAEIKNYIFKNGNLTKGNKTLIISLSKNERSMENPWSYNVSDFKVK